MMQRLKLPIGIQTFSKLREEGCYYVDKTPYIAQLAAQGGNYFLSRPRRFGKSLFLDTLAEAFAGNRSLFAGLYLEQHWDWSKRYPVIRLSFANGILQSRAELDKRIIKLLHENAQQLGVECDDGSDVAGCLSDFIVRAAAHYGQRAVVLVDEYDKPILDNLDKPAIAREMREGLKNVYSVFKGRDAELKFVFLTGVSKFSKVSIFSGLNNLSDITLDSRYAVICGYTDTDIDSIFAPELTGLDRQQIREWYNGYRWDGEAIYNPFDVLLLFDKRQYRAHWFETGTPTFLVNWLKERQFYTPQLEQLVADDELLSSFDVDSISIEAMLWQTGYLTIGRKEDFDGLTAYTLRLPNREVRQSLNRSLLGTWLPQDTPAIRQSIALRKAFANNDLAYIRSHFQRLYAGIPHQWYRNNPLAEYEGYYASVFYSHLAALGLDIIPEDVSNQGQCDLSIRMGTRVYVLEFKVVEGTQPCGAALQQLQARNYAAKYRHPETEVIQIGVEFSKTQRQIIGWEVA